MEVPSTWLLLWTISLVLLSEHFREPISVVRQPILYGIFGACLSGKDRQAHWEELLEEFYGYLKEEVGDRKMPYTLEQLKEAYRQYFPIGAFMIVAVVGPFFEMVCKSSDEETKKKVPLLLLQKFGGTQRDFWPVRTALPQL
ncbi:hypothetical protein OSTOST_20547 [Ostertagia ostertagi]